MLLHKCIFDTDTKNYHCTETYKITTKKPKTTTWNAKVQQYNQSRNHTTFTDNMKDVTNHTQQNYNNVC